MSCYAVTDPTRTASLPDPSPWLPGLLDDQEDLPRLFCFAYAGGTSELYRQWQQDLRQTCRICPVELPGRGSRFGEPFANSLTEAAIHAAEAIASYSQHPYALFGHSLGSVMALETARHLQRLNVPAPLCLIVSGRFPPHAESVRRRFHVMPDAALLDEMRRLGGTPDEVLEHREILDMLLPVVRDDFRLLETHEASMEPLVRIPVHVCCGMDDEDSPPSLLDCWAEITEESCRIRLFEGGHFYINESREALLRHIIAVIREETGTTAQARRA